MTRYAAEIYKQITGTNPLKPFSEKTAEERRVSRDRSTANSPLGTAT